MTETKRGKLPLHWQMLIGFSLGLCTQPTSPPTAR